MAGDVNVQRKRCRRHGLVELRREVTAHYIFLVDLHVVIVCRDLVCLDFWSLESWKLSGLAIEGELYLF